MMRKYLIHTIIIIFGITSCLPIHHAECIKPEQIGLYGTSWVPWVVKLENAKRIGFIIYQVTPKSSIADIINFLQECKKVNIKVVLDIEFYLDYEQRANTHTAKPLGSIEHYESIFARVLDNIIDFPVEAVTIEEENVYWSGRAEFLSNLYYRLKKRYPDIKFYQWYTPSKQLNIPGKEWPDLPSDGWIIDQYVMSGDMYEKYIQGIVALGKPIISIVWASPNWKVGQKGRVIDNGWWNKEGREIVQQQIVVNKKYNIPTTFYMFWLNEDRVLLPLWKVKDKCVQKFFYDLFSDMQFKEIPYFCD